MKHFLYPLGLILNFNAPAQHQPHETWGMQKQAQTPSKFLPTSKQRSKNMVSSEGDFRSHQVNLSASGQNIVNDAANEPSIAVNPNNPQQIAIGWRQFNTIFSDFRQAGVAYTSDGGLTWMNQGPLEPGIFRSDPVLAASADGTFYYQSLAVEDNNGQPGIQADDFFQVDQWQSIDGGETWINKINAFGGDKSWFAVDQSSETSQGNIYAAWNVAGNQYFPNTFNYSVDNGNSFSLPEQITNKPVFGTVAVGFDGEVYVVGGNGDVGPFSEIHLLRSNNPTSQMFPDFQQVTAIDLGGQISSGDVNPFGLLGQIWVAADKSNRHTRGHVYVFSSIDPTGTDRLDVNFTRSTDGGISFKPFTRINDDTETINRQWFGTMAVAPNGRVDLIWLDTRDSESISSLPSSSRLFYSYSYDGGITFSKNQAISQDFDHFLGYPTQMKMGDYIDMASDNLGAHIAYTATFTGGQDVYYLFAKPAAVTENPYFPSHEMDGIWHNPDVPRQGVVSKTLVSNLASGTPTLTNFEAIFTEDLTGKPTWFVLQNTHPSEADFIEYVISFPTGDLSSTGTSLRPIGLATKSRVYDDQGELLKNKLEYAFDMSAEVMNQVAQLSQNETVFDVDFYTNSPFYQTQKTITLTPVVAPEQDRSIYCKTHNLTLVNQLEKSEGRMPVVFQTNTAAQVFMADFTYVKEIDEQGNQVLTLDEDGLASPTWQVMNTISGDILSDQPITNAIYKPNGGNGFFKETNEDTGLSQIGTEIFDLTTEFELLSTNSQGVSETFEPIAFNSYCGDTR